MKIRTITTGITLDKSLNLKEIEKAAHFNIQAMQRFEDSGYAVQSTRVSTNPCYEYLNSLSNNEIMSKLREVDRLASSEAFFALVM